MPDNYLYPNSNVLINKEDIMSQEKLELLESAIVNTKLVKLRNNLNMTQVELSKLLNIQLSQLEIGKIKKEHQVLIF